MRYARTDRPNATSERRDQRSVACAGTPSVAATCSRSGSTPTRSAGACGRGASSGSIAGVYAAGGSPPTQRTAVGGGSARVRASGALLSHLSAAAMWAIRRRDPVVIDVSLAARSGRRSRDGIRLHRPRSLRPDDITEHRGIPVTTVARTLIDLATVARRPLAGARPRRGRIPEAAGPPRPRGRARARRQGRREPAEGPGPPRARHHPYPQPAGGGLSPAIRRAGLPAARWSTCGSAPTPSTSSGPTSAWRSRPTAARAHDRERRPRARLPPRRLARGQRLPPASLHLDPGPRPPRTRSSPPSAPGSDHPRPAAPRSAPPASAPPRLARPRGPRPWRSSGRPLPSPPAAGGPGAARARGAAPRSPWRR